MKDEVAIMTDKRKNLKSQLILLIWAAAQTLIWVLTILFVVLCVKKLIIPEDIKQGQLQFVTNIVCIALPMLSLVYIPTMLLVKEKGRLNGLTEVDSVYYNSYAERVRLGTFSDYAQFQNSRVLLYFALSPISFLLQLTAVIFAIISFKSRRIMSVIGLVDYSKLNNEGWQRVCNILFNFVVLPKSEPRHNTQSLPEGEADNKEENS